MTTAVDTTKATDGKDPGSNRPVPPGSTMVTLLSLIHI